MLSVEPSPKFETSRSEFLFFDLNNLPEMKNKNLSFRQRRIERRISSKFDELLSSDQCP